ncbi:MAG: hypothetical protein PHY99_00345 [Bacteroidales bacterium]|nr:hypothetical protein [Bacteroidales bacterium]
MVILRYLPARFTFVILMCLSLSGCHKEDIAVITGVVKDTHLVIPVDKVKVELWTQHIEEGVFLANYVLEGSVITVTDGAFSFNLTKKNYTGIRLKISKEGYYECVSELDPEIVKNGQRSDESYFLLAKAWLRIHVKNSEPFNSSDFFEFRIMNSYSSCETCCKETSYQFIGLHVDEDFECQNSGNRNIYIQSSNRKNNTQTIKTDTIYVKGFDTTDIDFFY